MKNHLKYTDNTNREIKTLSEVFQCDFSSVHCAFINFCSFLFCTGTKLTLLFTNTFSKNCRENWIKRKQQLLRVHFGYVMPCAISYFYIEMHESCAPKRKANTKYRSAHIERSSIVKRRALMQTHKFISNGRQIFKWACTTVTGMSLFSSSLRLCLSALFSLLFVRFDSIPRFKFCLHLVFAHSKH